MKNISLNTFFISCLVFFFSGCSKMNDLHSEFLKGGERVYIGKVDSLKTFAGDERIKLQFWASDPRVKSLVFYWIPGNDSLIVDIDKTSSGDSYEVFIGGQNSPKVISEGSYTLKTVTTDNLGNYSLPFAKIINVYGDQFRSNLFNRRLQSVEYQVLDGSVLLYFTGPVNDKEIGVEITFDDMDEIARKLILLNSEITSPVKLSNVNISNEVSYRSLFLPEPSAVDTFFISKTIIEIPN
ncbi:DUF4998 domain-containing protein [Gaoshiqia sp. Z1-71]|uniref:DUF4998 domain-containing protein n=1 Tax=Gaoshiqia hydrogeniformans TaxID=3290090 RepID=UPI003BF87F6A